MELLDRFHGPLKLSVYMEMTLHIFHTINCIKHIKNIPDVEES